MCVCVCVCVCVCGVRERIGTIHIDIYRHTFTQKIDF